MSKKIIICVLLLCSMNIYSQEELQWIDGDNVAKERYQLMDNFIKEEVVFAKDRFCESKSFFSSINDIFTRGKREKEFTSRVRKEKEQTKLFMNTHFIIEDSVMRLVFFNKEQILKWSSKTRFIVGSTSFEEFNIYNNNIFIVLTDRCSGIPCISIDVYMKNKGVWQLITSSLTSVSEKILITIDDESKEILFNTKSRPIGSLNFDVFKF